MVPAVGVEPVQEQKDATADKSENSDSPMKSRTVAPSERSPVAAVVDPSEQNTSRMGNPLPVDLQELAGMWERLPEAVRAGLLATARAVAGASSDSSHGIERTQANDGEDTGR
jgi:hypothetical protein